MKEFFIKAGVATAIETLNSNFKTESTKQTKDKSSRIMSKLTSKFQAKTQEIFEEFTATNIRRQTVEMNEELSKKIQNDLRNAKTEVCDC
jgi:dsDNA-specific endonuclease/ATPase MutS2